jgi:hypothetical protein
MLRSVASKVAWVGRATVFLVGLAVILAVMFGVASAALGTTGQSFILGKANNTADTPTGLVSTLSDAAKSALIVNNKSGGAALDLRVGSHTVPPADETVPPMKVNSQARVANFNAESAGFADDAAQATNADNATNADKLDDEELQDVVPGGTLPSGATIRGTYNMYDEAHINEDATSDSISFGYTLASTPTVHVIEEGESLTIQCPQRGDEFTGEVPEAAPGFLCIYEWDEENERDGSGYPFISNTNRTGIGIALRSESTGIFYSEGVWAVTAP